MFKTLVILRYSFLEMILQPIFPTLLTVGASIMIIFGMLPFFTLGEDTQMFKSVCMDVILILVLLITMFGASKSIFDEIEDRTMLTLMSKPVRRWQVILGKYLGIIAAAALGVAILGAILLLATWIRIPGDYYLDTMSIDDIMRKQVIDTRKMHLFGLMPQLVLTWLQISVLAAVGVALSTRFSLVVNLPAVIMLYLAGNMMRFLFPMSSGPLQDRSVLVKGGVWFCSLIFPYLESFDLKDLALMSTLKLSNSAFANESRGVTLWTLWAYVGVAFIYAAVYAAFALSAGLLSFQNRELGGGEG
jgi:ABC-type transport system involved in multi-copper enzyme maturation permease subunit